MIAHGGDSAGGYIPYLATAGHLLPEANVATHFRLTRYTFEDLANPMSRMAEFEMPHAESTRKTPAYIKIGDKDGLSRLDIGLIRAPITCIDGQPWFVTNKPSTESMSIQPASAWAAEGSQVAWAGFPALAMDIARRPQPCYYQGVISSLLIRNEFQMYLIDGHNTFGISGGPVWWINAESRVPTVIGIVSSYRFSKQMNAMPGLVAATPIQLLLSLVFQDYVAKTSTIN